MMKDAGTVRYDREFNRLVPDHVANHGRLKRYLVFNDMRRSPFSLRPRSADDAITSTHFGTTPKPFTLRKGKKANQRFWPLLSQ